MNFGRNPIQSTTDTVRILTKTQTSDLVELNLNYD